MAKSKSPLDIALQKLNVTRNKARSTWSFSGESSRTVGDFLRSVGLDPSKLAATPEELAARTTLADVNGFFVHYERRLRYELQVADVGEPAASDAPLLERAAWYDCPVHKQEAPPPPQTIVYEQKPITSFPAIAPSEEEKLPEDWWSEVYKHTFPGQKATLLPKQVKAAGELVGGILLHRKRGLQLLAGTGVGKTYVLGSVIRNLFEAGFFSDCPSPYPALYITKAPIVTQTDRVLVEEFGIDPIKQLRVVNIEGLRCSFGEMFLRKIVKYVDGQPKEMWAWTPYIAPKFIIWDENQILKNESTQSAIAQAYNRLKQGPETYQIFSSATPFTRVCEARCFCVATRIKHDFGVARNVELTDEHWNSFASSIAAPALPTDYNGASVDRLTDKMDAYIVRMKNVRPKFHAKNGVEMIDLETQEEKEDYAKAIESFYEEKRKIEGDASLSEAQGRFRMLAEFTILRKKIEWIKAPYLARRIVKAWDEGFAPGVAVAFKGTITRIVRELVENYGWTRADISIVWGGSMESVSKKKKLAKRMASMPELLAALKQEDIDLSAFGLDFDPSELIEKSEVEIEWERSQNLLSQNQVQRQAEIDRFQKQQSRCALITFKSGGAGLSLHHALPEARPRKAWLSFVYSAMELAQGLGRFPRLTSRSDTEQMMLAFRDTIEESVAASVSTKLNCLGRVVRQKESWMSVIVGQKYVPPASTDGGDDEDDATEGTYIEEQED